MRAGRIGRESGRPAPLCYNFCFGPQPTSGTVGRQELVVKEGIHPKYELVDVRCACGNTFKTRSTKSELHLEICGACHPFFTGRQKLIDTEGRVERFNKKFGVQTSEQRKTAEKAAKATRAAAAKKTKTAKAKTATA